MTLGGVHRRDRMRQGNWLIKFQNQLEQRPLMLLEMHAWRGWSAGPAAVAARPFAGIPPQLAGYKAEDPGQHIVNVQGGLSTLSLIVQTKEE